MGKIAIVLIVSMVIGVGFLSGCTEQTGGEIKTVGASLNTLGLALDDFSGDFEITDEEYVTEPYVIKKGFLEGTKVLERYNVSFTEGESSLIIQGLVRCDSKETCKSALDMTKTELGADFPEISANTIGDDSYLGEMTTTFSGTEISMYLLCFRIADVLVILTGTALLQFTFRGYGNIIESNINAVLTGE